MGEIRTLKAKFVVHSVTLFFEVWQGTGEFSLCMLYQALSTWLFQKVHTYLLVVVGNQKNLISETLRAKDDGGIWILKYCSKNH
jgi:hypothetical protein